MVQHLDVQDVPRLAVITKPVTRMRTELEKSEKGREYFAREQTRADARKQEQPSSSRHKRAVSEEWGHPPEKF